MRRRVPVVAAGLSGQRPGGDGPGPQVGLLDGQLRQVAALRRQRRWRLAAAAAVLAAAAAARYARTGNSAPFSTGEYTNRAQRRVGDPRGGL